MDDVQFFKIRSWHAVRLFSDRVGHTYAYCGKKQLDAEIVDTLPYNERSCEQCLKILARKVDA